MNNKRGIVAAVSPVNDANWSLKSMLSLLEVVLVSVMLLKIKHYVLHTFSCLNRSGIRPLSSSTLPLTHLSLPFDTLPSLQGSTSRPGLSRKVPILLGSTNVLSFR